MLSCTSQESLTVGDTKADQEELYYRVNRDLTIEVAEKAKAEGVKQFIFMSSMIVYGASKLWIVEMKVITADTPARPTNFYGNSKSRTRDTAFAVG